MKRDPAPLSVLNLQLQVLSLMKEDSQTVGYICFVFLMLLCQSIRTVFHILTSKSVSVICVCAVQTQELFVEKKIIKTTRALAYQPFQLEQIGRAHV